MRRLLYVCFFLSGAAGLIYEVVWARQLGLFLGITAYAHTAVITAYMAGLAAGSLVIGRYADRHARPLVLYAAVGLYAALTPWLFPALQALYAGTAGAAGVAGTGAHASRFGLALAALLVPTFLMGGTLPLLVRGLTRELPELGSITGRLYGINTLGATLGAFAAGYLLLPGIGVASSIFVGVALNLAVAGAVFLMAGGRPPRPVPSETARKPRRKGDASARASRPEPLQPPEPLRPWVAAVVLIGFAAAGFASLLSQLAWIRALILVVGSSVYAFTITLTSFLAGIGIGSLLFGRFLAGRGRTGVGDGLALAAGLAVFIGFAVLLSLLAIGKTPGLFLHAFEAGLQESFLLFQALIFGLNFLIMLLPTLGMGALFPLITVLWTRNAAAVGGGVGTAYAVNTAGTILGSVLGGLVLLPSLGVHGSLVLAAGIYLTVALGFWLVRPTQVRAAPRYALATGVLLGFAAAVVLLPPWNRVLMSAGVYYDPDRYLRQGAENPLTGGGKDEQLVYYAEGLDGTVAVFDRQSYRTLVINGKVDASSSGDMPTQVLLGRLPMLMHPAPRRALIVGLGSGVTAAAVVAAGKALDSLTVLEISPEVVEASRFFAPENGDVLSDPRVDLALADARNYLMAAPGRYDLIISEPSNPWISGISNLFTRDFFELARSRLAPGGLMVQWFHLYGMSEADLQSVLRTYGSVFPHVSVWTPLLGDLILVGSDAPHALDYGLLAQALARDDGPLSLKSIRVEKPRDLVRTFLMGGPELTRYASGVPLNTDDRPRIEFNAPRNLYATGGSVPAGAPARRFRADPRGVGRAPHGPAHPHPAVRGRR